MNGYSKLKAMAKATGCTIDNLLVLAPQNDPFYCGSPAQVVQAEWFADLYSRFDVQLGAHLRRIHYAVISALELTTLPNGEPYQNTQKCWRFLTTASKSARDLGLVDSENFTDHRNPPPVIHRAEKRGEQPFAYIDAGDLSLPGIKAEFQRPALSVPDPYVAGYGYDAADQPFLLEIWIEKSTMNDVLIPMASQYHANLITSIGFQSKVAASNLVKRAQSAAKPARVFYIADFDPAGDKMPQAVARQVEFKLAEIGGDQDIAIHHLALTKDQVIEWKIPRIPIKDTDRRRTNFEDRYGEGAAELDALEVIRPGALAELVENAIKPYWDDGLARRAAAQQDAVADAVAEDWITETAEEQASLDRLAIAAAAVYARYQDELADLSRRMSEDLAPLREQLASIDEAIAAKIETFDPDLPPRLVSTVAPPEASQDWLFRADRDYFDQLAAYHRFSMKEAA